MDWIARLSQSLWTTTPKNFYHPNQLSIRCVVYSFNSWATVPLSVVVQTHWLNLANSSGGRVVHMKREDREFEFSLQSLVFRQITSITLR